jgi:diguanylate cyclase (GGDEF)-like protein
MQLEELNASSPWATVFDVVGFGLVLVDADARVVLWNGWMTRHSGIRASEALGRPLADVFGTAPSASFTAALRNALRYKLPVVLSNVLHRCPLPLYAQLSASESSERLAHAITLTPLTVAPWGPCCLIQVNDSSLSISREKILQKNSDRLSREVMTDGLTRAFSRGFFDQLYQQEFAQARRQSSKLSIIMVDVDFFKNYNDEYGHPAGDKVLIAVVQVMKEGLLRATDKLFRYGGEEFAVILPDCAQPKAMGIAEQLRLAVMALKLAHCKSETFAQVTISLGVSTLEPDVSCGAQALIEAADNALYAAKHHGRNCVQYCSPLAALAPA